MAKQARAVQTRRTIVEAAASVFADHGYERSATSEILRRAGVTKGAMYFHFPSKESLAQAIMDEQTAVVGVANSSPLQSLIDMTHRFAHALRNDPIARAGTRLSIEGVFVQGSHPWGAWFDLTTRLLVEGQQAGEVLPQLDTRETAEFFVASFTGVQLIAEAICGRADLHERVTVMWRHILPSVAQPSAIARLRPEGVSDPAALAGPSQDDAEDALEAGSGAA
ncbi:ScbR family autoregulator-binding transcription factor [Streptomyces sp. SHP 1-2]|uniref:ScbR family autoregulator-binding transcription factor n=1 Tax=Streptomyces sp. SHP 1-2 TaxID=2769489 RepID=UPI002240E862|nr:TetR/AcrR family transcriptional regulator [Streptomyces sp. SHP 1-2]